MSWKRAMIFLHALQTLSYFFLIQVRSLIYFKNGSLFCTAHLSRSEPLCAHLLVKNNTSIGGCGAAWFCYVDEIVRMEKSSPSQIDDQATYAALYFHNRAPYAAVTRASTYLFICLLSNSFVCPLHWYQVTVFFPRCVVGICCFSCYDSIDCWSIT